MAICKDCIYNGTAPFRKDKQPIVMNKPKAVCWCAARNGVVRKALKGCDRYEAKVR